MKDIIYKTEKVFYDALFNELYVVAQLYCKENGIRYRYIKMESPSGSCVVPDMLQGSESAYYKDICTFIGDL